MAKLDNVALPHWVSVEGVGGEPLCRNPYKHSADCEGRAAVSPGSWAKLDVKESAEVTECVTVLLKFVEVLLVPRWCCGLVNCGVVGCVLADGSRGVVGLCGLWCLVGGCTGTVWLWCLSSFVVVGCGWWC